MLPLHWENERELQVGGVRFLCTLGDYSARTTSDRIVLLKNRRILDDLAVALQGREIATALEFGIYQGGSPALYSMWLGLKKIVGIDICKPVPAFDDFCAARDNGTRIRSHYEVCQTDANKIRDIVRDEFGGEALDLVVDDASHLYPQSRRTFEIAFPLLKPGGLYIIEDWGWAHWPDNRQFLGQSSLSILIMELTMLCASRDDLIEEIRLFPWFAMIRKSERAPALRELELGALYSKRGLEIVTAERTPLTGIARIKWQRFRARLANKAHSIRKRFPQ